MKSGGRKLSDNDLALLQHVCLQIYLGVYLASFQCGRLRLKCDDTRAETNFVFRRNGRVHWNRQGRQFIRLLAAEVCASAVVMLDTPCSEVAWRVMATHSIRQFPLHFPSRASPYAITFQLDSTLKSFLPHSFERVTTSSTFRRCVNSILKKCR